MFEFKTVVRMGNVKLMAIDGENVQLLGMIDEETCSLSAGQKDFRLAVQYLQEVARRLNDFRGNEVAISLILDDVEYYVSEFNGDRTPDDEYIRTNFEDALEEMTCPEYPNITR